MSEDRCIMCGAIIPEGRMVCPSCERKADRMYKLVIPGNPATKKNSSQIVRNPKTGRYFITPSKTYKDWSKHCGSYINIWTDRPNKPIDYPVIITYTFYRQKRVKVDGLNLSAAMDDILSFYGVIADDNRDVVVGHDGTRVFYDKENPRVEISIVPYTEEWTAWSAK